MWFRKPSLMESIHREIQETSQALLSHAAAREYHAAMEVMLLARNVRLCHMSESLTVHQMESAPSVPSAPKIGD